MFAVCGEALFDVYAAGETPHGLQLDARIGGSPFNVAVGLSRLGQRACLVTQISNGFLGERLMRALADEGVDASTVQRSDAPTTLSLVGVDAQGVPSYAFYGEGCADRELNAHALQTLPTAVQALHFGSYATVVGQTAETQRALVLQEQGRRLISYDPNVRLNVEPDVQRWREQLGWMQACCHLLKVSDEDLGLLLPGLAPEAFAAQCLEAGVRLVVVTRGAEGAAGWTRGAKAKAEPVRVAVVDTVGAGDTFQAALLTWLAEHDRLTPEALSGLDTAALVEALAFAARAAAITCSRRGADLPRRHEV